MPNIKMVLAYDGNGYLGWQKTAMGPSIEETLQTVLEKILQEKITLQAASRTDAGVHARGQVVNFITNQENLCFHRLKHSINSLLPNGIVVLTIAEACPDFHPTLDCREKEYHYTLAYGEVQLPEHRHYSWHYPHIINFDEMFSVSQVFVGSHDFSAFCNFKKNATYEHYVRTIKSVQLLPLSDERLKIEIVGNNFLYKMVRNIVGTLVYVGIGKIPSGEIQKILSNKDRTKAGVTAPAHGLSLHRIIY